VSRIVGHVLLFVIRVAVPFFATAVLLVITGPLALLVPVAWWLQRRGARARVVRF
jgi:hypothetical protein